MYNRVKRIEKFFILSALVIIALVQWNCTPKDKGTVAPNQPPVAHLANVPADDTTTVSDSAKTTKSSLVKLFWVGNDADGFVTAFMYRWSYKDSMNSSAIHYRRWTVVLNYVPFDDKILILDVDSNQVFGNASASAPGIFKFFANTDLDPDKRNVTSPFYDTALVNMFARIERGDTVVIQGTRVYASNPTKEAYPVHESPNSGTFIFESNDAKNRHQFEILAIDNEGAISRPDSVRFWTRQVEKPRLVITAAPSQIDTIFVLKNATLTWPGIYFTFKASDRNSRTWEYSVKLDNRDWSDWSPKSKDAVSAIITASVLDTPYTATHRFQVRARNEFGAITPPDSQPVRFFRTIYPDIAIPGTPKRVLVINISRPPSILTEPESEAFPGIARENAFIREVLDSVFNGDTTKFTFWPGTVSGTGTGSAHPPLSVLSRFSAVAIFQENFRVQVTTANKILTDRYTKYLDVGGTFFMDGINWWVALQIFDNLQTLPINHMAINGFDAFSGYYPDRNLPGRGAIGFVGARGNKGYPTVALDTAKLDTSFHGSLANISIFLPRGFGEKIYFFDAKCNTCTVPFGPTFLPLEGQSMGIRYLGSTFQTVMPGFPLYYIEKSQAIALMKKALKDLKQY